MTARSLLLLVLSVFICLFTTATKAQMVQQRYLKLSYNSNNKYAYTITMKDGSKKTVYSKMYTDDDGDMPRAYLLSVNKELDRSDSNRSRKIYASQTKQVIRFDELTNERLEGIPTDSCWLFPIFTGRLTIYSAFAEKDDIENPTRFKALQVAGGPVEPYSEERAAEVMKNNEKAIKALKRKNFKGAFYTYNNDPFHH